MFYYLIRTSFSANLKEYGAHYRNPYLLLQNIEKIAQRLARVVIENSDFQYILKRYDKQGTLFYCDPPYYKSEKMYVENHFNKQQHILLKDSLRHIKGRFVLR